MRTAAIAVGMALGACAAAFGQGGGEALVAKAPAGFDIGYNASNSDMAITESVPAKQSVSNWTDMVTIQVFYGLKTSPAQFMAKIEKLVSEACPGASIIEIKQGEENGYRSIRCCNAIKFQYFSKSAQIRQKSSFYGRFDNLCNCVKFHSSAY